MKQWIARWEAYWFPTTPVVDLALCRIIAVASQLTFFFPSLDEHLNLLRKNPVFIEPQVLIRAIAAVVPRGEFFTPSVFTALYWVTAIAGVATLIGLATRVAAFVFALGTWIFVSHLFSYGDRHHTEAIFCIFLLLLAFSPSGDALSVDAYVRRRRGRPRSAVADTAIWPLKLVHVLLGLSYFSAGMSKLITGGPRWLNGYTLQNHAFQDAVYRGFPVGMWLAQHHHLAILLSVFTIFFEVFFFVSLFVPWTQPLFFMGGLLFHIGLYATGGYDFFQHMVLLVLLLLFVAPPWWRTWLGRYLEVLRPRSRRAAQVHGPS